MTEFVKHIAFDSSAKFLDAFSDHPTFPLRYQSAFLFRGQADANWDLTPSAFRSEGTSTLNRFAEWRSQKDNVRATPLIESTARRILEIELVGEFFMRCEKLGLPVPNLSGQAFRVLQSTTNPDDRHSNLGRIEWPDRDLLPAFALAQHYGVPTRLLDWSGNPLTAAYFAASSSLAMEDSGREPAERFAVWRIIKSGVEAGNWLLPKLRRSSEDMKFGCDVIPIPAAGNNNLRAQHGMFTITYNDLNSHQTIDQVLGNLSSIIKQLDDPKFRDHQIKTKLHDPCEVTKYTLPATEAKNLIRELLRLGVGAMTVFPTFEGSRDAILDEIRISEK